MDTVKPLYCIWKNLGETPLEALETLREREEIAPDVPMTYAGRLDPAAEGLLIVLTGEECKNKDQYSGLPKTYMAEILLGVSTDSFDLLGLPTAISHESAPALLKIQEYIDTRLGTQAQQYPPYSSKTVEGKQLHAYTREGSEVSLPTHEVTLYEYAEIGIEPVESEDVLTRVGEVASLVTGDFRQNEIVAGWAEIGLPEKLSLLTVTLSVGSGFYVRQFAEDLGKALGTQACLYSLIRTKIGDHTSVDI